MKFKVIYLQLTKTICVLTILSAKYSLSLSYHTAQYVQKYRPQFNYNQLQFNQHHDVDDNYHSNEKITTKETEDLQRGIYYNKVASNVYYGGLDHYHRAQHQPQPQQQQHFNSLHMKELAESAKDPKNLRNGIYHNGAITYDLGLPNYEILNPHDPPEIITSDHPKYEEQLNHIKKTNNFTIEDFGITTTSVSDTTAETTTLASTTTTITTTDAITTTEIPETTTTNMRFLFDAATTTTPSPIEKYKNIKSDIEKHLNKTREKLRILNNEIELKHRIHKITSIPTDDVTGLKFVIVRKNENPISKQKQMRMPIIRQDQEQSLAVKYSSNEDAFQIPQPQTNVPNESFEKDTHFLNNFYGQSVVLPVDNFRLTNYLNKFGSDLPPPSFYHSHSAYSPQPYQNQHNVITSSNVGDITHNESLYRSSSVHSSMENNILSSLPVVPPPITNNK